jgi:thiamine biosynthesis protein ThiS
MKLVVNGDQLVVADALTVKDLIHHMGLGSGPVAVERNGAVVPRKDHETTVLVDGDRVEIVHFVGGG